jgi:hypothetical protein
MFIGKYFASRDTQISNLLLPTHKPEYPVPAASQERQFTLLLSTSFDFFLPNTRGTSAYPFYAVSHYTRPQI